MIATPTSVVNSSTISPDLFQGIQGTDMIHGPVPVSMKPTCVTTPGPIQPTASPLKSMVKSNTNMLQTAPGFMMQQNAPPESYSAPQVIPVQTPTASPLASHKRPSSVPIVSHDESGSSSSAPNSQVRKIKTYPTLL